MASILGSHAESDQGAICEPSWSKEAISATDSFHKFLDEPTQPPAWKSELIGNDAQAFHPATIGPTALCLDFVTHDKDGRTHSDTYAVNADMSLTFEDLDLIDWVVKEESEDERAAAEREETPETGRGDERPLSEDEDMSLAPGDPAGSQNTSPSPRVNKTGSSDTHVRPRSGDVLQNQPSQVNSPVQPFGYLQPMPHPPMPHQPMLHQPMLHRPMPHQSFPQQFLPQQSLAQQYVPHATPGNTSLQFPQQVAQPPHIQPAHYTGPINQLDNHGPVFAAMTHVNRGSFAPIAYGGRPPQAPPYLQAPIQTSPEGRPQASPAAYTHVLTRPENAAGRSINASWNQDPANSWPSPRANLPPNTCTLHTGSLPQGGSGFRPRHPSQLNPSAAAFQPQQLVSSQDHETPQQYMPPQHSATRSEAVIKENQNQHSSEGTASPAPHRNEATNPPGNQIPRVTTPEAEHFRNSQPRLRHQSVLNVKILIVAFKIMVMRKRGHPYTGLPGVTAEDVHEFRRQYRAMPVFIWSRELRVPDDMVTAILQAIRLRGLYLVVLWQLRLPSVPAQPATIARSAKPKKSTRHSGTTRPDDDGHVPEYLLDEFMAILAQSGEQEALRFLRESKAKAAGESQGSGSSRRKRRTAITGMSDESPKRRAQGFTLDDIFSSGDDEPYGGMDAVIDDDLQAFGITEIKNASGQIMARVSSRRGDNVNSSPALNRTVDIHIEDDLVGAAESSTPVEKFRRLMNSSPTQKSRKKRAKV